MAEEGFLAELRGLSLC